MTGFVVNPEDIKGADPAAILNHCSRMRYPFGVHTYTLRPALARVADNFVDLAKERQEAIVQHVIMKAIQKYLKTSSVSEVDATTITLKTMASKDLKHKFRMAALNPNYCNATCIAISGNKGKKAHEFEPDDYKEPSWSLVLAPSKGYSAKGFFRYSTGANTDKMPEFPGKESQYRLFSLWHEYAHTAGADEPQADKMAGLVYRQLSPEDPRVIHVKADMRAVSAVLRGNFEKTSKKYGWAMVTALDTVAAMDQSTINEMSMEDIKAIRFEKFDHHWESVKAVREVLSFICPTILPNADTHKVATAEGLKKLGVKILDCIDAGIFDEAKDAKKIGLRFAMAALRLTSGDKHYAPVLQKHGERQTLQGLTL